MTDLEQFDWNAFIDDTNELSLAAVGGWLKCLHKMRKSVTRGRISMPIEGYARMFGSSVDQAKRVIDELLSFGTASSEVSDINENITLINRRMYRDWKTREDNRIRQLEFQQRKRAEQAKENNGNITAHNGNSTLSSSLSSQDNLDTRRKKEKKEVEEIFAFWQERLGHGRTILTRERSRYISNRLAEGYTVDDMKQAIEGCKVSPFHNGKNDSGAIYHGIDLIFRSGSKVEQFISYAPPPTEPPKPFVPPPPCDICGKDTCLSLHREERGI